MAIKYIPFNPTVLQGQAVLSNFTRTRKILSYRGDDEVEPHITRGMPLYETKEIEKYGENKDGNLIIRGECVSACAYLKEKGITVDLVYIDPPFASGANYAKKIYLRRNPKIAQQLADANANKELDNEELMKFEAKMYGDIWETEKYLNWMYENLMAIKSVMSPTGTIFVHLDYNISHYVKILMDEIFGQINFLNNIVWCYQTRQFGKKYFNRKHHDIFWYSLNPDNYVYNWDDPNVIQNYSEATIKKYKLKDEKGYYRLCGRGIEGSPIKGAKDVDPKWEIEHPELVVRDYLGDGFAPPDYWFIDIVNQAANERVDYATQKPEALLTKIICAASNKGMVVADFFGGSGVAAAVASKTNRKFIHVDINTNSIETARDRLVKEGAEFTTLEIQDGVSLFRNPVQTDELIPTLIPGLMPDRSLSSYWNGVINDSKLGKLPVHLPKFVAGAEARVVSVATVHKLIYEELSQLDNIKKVIIYFIDLEDKSLIDEYIHTHNTSGIDIEFRDLKIVLDNIVAQDEAELEVNEVQDGLMTKWEVNVISFVSDRVNRKIDDFNAKAAFNNSDNSREICLSESGLEAIEWISVDCTTADPKAPWNSTQEIRIETDSYISINGTKTRNFWDGKITSEDRPLRVKIRNICGDESIFVLNHE